MLDKILKMIDRFLYWGDHGNQKSGEIKGSCQSPLVQTYSYICKVENLFAVQVSVRTQNCHTLPLPLIDLLTPAVG